MLEGVAEVLRRLRPHLIVQVAHMELAHPTISEGMASCVLAGATEITVHPYMLSPGRHATKDVPRMVDECSKKYPQVNVKVTKPLGIHDKIGEVVLERAEL